jgi:D-3-phosphoglycerate dehydrogenase / 2-oxoglutarate reductase
VNMAILISTSSFGRQDRQPLDVLEASGVRYQLNPYGRKLKPEETMALLEGVDGLIAGTELLDRHILEQAHRLKVISRVGTGLDNVDLAAAQELDIQVYNTPDAHVDAVAELTLAGMLDVLRQVSYADRQVRQGQWNKPMGLLLRGKTIGIIGLGRIGKAVVRLLQPFGVTVLAYEPYPDHDFAQQYGVAFYGLEDVLGQADVVSLHLSYSAANRNLLDAPRLAQMKPGAFLVNCARGGLVDEDALYEALGDGRLSGAFVDTFAQEPYQGPLAELENIVLTTHIGSYAAEVRLRMEMEAVENLVKGLKEVMRDA